MSILLSGERCKHGAAYHNTALVCSYYFLTATSSHQSLGRASPLFSFSSLSSRRTVVSSLDEYTRVLSSHVNLRPARLSQHGSLTEQMLFETVRNKESVKPNLRMYTTEVTPKYMAEWDLANVRDPVMEKFPRFTKILECATYSKETWGLST